MIDRSIGTNMSADPNSSAIAYHWQPDYGAILRWPQDGKSWIHPEDREWVEQFVPSRRVFRRESFDGEYYLLRYGAIRLRIKPCLWWKVAAEDIEIGDQVEVLSQLGQVEPLIGQISEKMYDPHQSRIYYLLRNREVQLTREYFYHELQRLNMRPQLREPSYEHQPQRMGVSLVEIDTLKLDPLEFLPENDPRSESRR